MSAPHRITTKAWKLTVVVPMDQFPLQLCPFPGTPGGKGMNQIIELATEDGLLLQVPLSGAKLMTLGKQIREADKELGGVVLFTGRLTADTQLVDGGAVFQPRTLKSEKAA